MIDIVQSCNRLTVNQQFFLSISIPITKDGSNNIFPDYSFKRNGYIYSIPSKLLSKDEGLYIHQKIIH